jgi:TRAP-type C4-dicarboxylate transport system permease small subunit
MNNHEPHLPKNGVTNVRRWIELLQGVLLGLFTVFCLISFGTLIFRPSEKAPILVPAIGAILIIICYWVLEKCIRLVSGRKREKGLMSPCALRSIGWFLLFLPIGGVFTGYFITHTLFAVVQAGMYISVFFGLHRIAASRETKYDSNEVRPEAVPASPPPLDCSSNSHS